MLKKTYISINNIQILSKKNITIIESLKYFKILIPRFCYHFNLKIAGNCRICLIEIAKSMKPIIACLLPVSVDLKIYINSPLVKKVRTNILELLLLNHPLDCPICDQGSECDLQDQSYIFGNLFSRTFFLNKRFVYDQIIIPLIKTIMTRCIHCTRCIRFLFSINIFSLGLLGRGKSAIISSYKNKISINQTLFSGHIVDICPVGALTINLKRLFTLQLRSWDYKQKITLNLDDTFGSYLIYRIQNNNILQVLPTKFNLISDRIRFNFDSININRLLYSSYRVLISNQLKIINWTDAFYYVSYIIYNCSFRYLKKKKYQFFKKCFGILSKNIDLESLFLLGKLCNKNNIISFFQYQNIKYTLNNCFQDIIFNKTIFMNTNFCFLLGFDSIIEYPLINQLLNIAVKTTNLKIYKIGSYNYINSNNILLTSSLFNKSNLGSLFISFYKTFYYLSNKKILFLYGLNFFLNTAFNFKKFNLFYYFLKFTSNNMINITYITADCSLLNLLTLHGITYFNNKLLTNKIYYFTGNLIFTSRINKAFIISNLTHKIGFLYNISNIILPTVTMLEFIGSYFNIFSTLIKTTLLITKFLMYLKSNNQIFIYLLLSFYKLYFSNYFLETFKINYKNIKKTAKKKSYFLNKYFFYSVIYTNNNTKINLKKKNLNLLFFPSLKNYFLEDSFSINSLNLLTYFKGHILIKKLVINYLWT